MLDGILGAIGVSKGHFSAAGVGDLSIYIGEITADVASAKSGVLQFSLRYQEISTKQTLSHISPTATYGQERSFGLTPYGQI
jgi:hypothetical protein